MASKKDKLQAGAKQTSNKLFQGMEQRAAVQPDIIGQLDTEDGLIDISASDKSRDIMLSGRVPEETAKRWRAYADATKAKPNQLKGISANILLEKALTEFMDKHILKGEQGKRYQANMKS